MSKKVLKIYNANSIIYLSTKERGYLLMRRQKILTTLFVMVLALQCAMTPVDTAKAATRYAKSYQVMELVGRGYNGGNLGPVSITRGYLRNGGWGGTVYLVTLSGTEFVKNQSTGVWTDILAGFNLNNAYYRNVANIVNSNVPRNSNIMFAGHSLGGMVAQQLAADGTLKANYNIVNTLTFGSPLLAAGNREGTVIRLGDTSDIVPYASGSTINNTAWAIAGLNKESGGYGMNAVAAHIQSYGRADVWGAYDAVGQKGGSAYIDLDTNTTRWYQSPTSVR